MGKYISKSAVVAEAKDLYEDIDKCIGDLILARSKHDQHGISDAHWKMETLMVNTQQVLSYILDTIEVKEVDLKQKSFVKIDRKLLFEICDAILNHYGYSDVNDCPENDSECFWGKWDEGFRKKVENIRRNS